MSPATFLKSARGRDDPLAMGTGGSDRHMSSAATSARQSEQTGPVLTPGGLAVQTLDTLLLRLERARYGIEAASDDILLPALEQAQSLLGDLLVMLDRGSNNDIGSRLATMYAFLMTELLPIASTRDVSRIERHMRAVRELRGAFAHVSRVE